MNGSSPPARERARSRSPPSLSSFVDEVPPLEMGSEVEVVATAKRGRGRPRINRPRTPTDYSSSDDDDDLAAYKSKKGSRKRPASNLGDSSKYSRKNSKRNDDEPYEPDEPYEKETKGRRGRRKKSSNEKKSRPPRDKDAGKSSNKNRSPSIDIIVDNSERARSSDEDSVVIMEDLPAPVIIPSTPPNGSPLSSDCEINPRPRKSADSSSGSGSGSGSNSDSDSDTSIGSRLTDKSDRSNPRSPLQNNGYDRHKSPSPLGGWCQPSSASDDEDYIGNKNGAGPSGTPPRSPSSASSESPDKSFQCHTCRKWFSSTVTLRIHKRTHLQKPGGGTSSGGRSSRRYECDCCDATFTRRERLEQHRSERHRSSLTVRCEVCGRGFEDEEQQKRHLASHTADERAGKCSECGKMTGGFSQLMQHRAVHASPAQHTCHLCRKAFTYVHSLSRHLMNHTKAVYKCVVCKTSFDDADTLAQHLNSHLDRYKQLKT